MRRHIHRYPSYTPAQPSSGSKPYVPVDHLPATSYSEDMERWSNKKAARSAAEIEEENDQSSRIKRTVEACLAADQEGMGTSESEPADSVHFMLKTNAGTLSYKPSEYSNYTDFLRVVIEMSLAFNSGEVDPEFKKIIKRAFAAYEGTEDFDDEDDDEYDNSEPEDMDFVPNALDNARSEADKWEKADKHISSLPKSETLTLKILQATSDLTHARGVEKILAKMTDLPPNIMHAVVHNNQSFSLPFKKASDVYVQLRMLGIPMTIKSGDDVKKIVATTTKSAAKKSGKKTATNNRKPKTLKKKTSAKKAPAKKLSTKKISAKKISNKPQLTGREKLRSTVGIIKSE